MSGKIISVWGNGNSGKTTFAVNLACALANRNCLVGLISSMLPYGTLELLSGRDWLQDCCLSLAGIYKPKKIIEESTPPAALMQYLKDFPQIKEIALHLDNDTAGGKDYPDSTFSRTHHFR